MGAPPRTIKELLNKKAPLNANMGAEYLNTPQTKAFSGDEFDDEVPNIGPKKSVKLANNASSVPQNIPKMEDFRKEIQKILTDEEEEKRVAFELGQKFFSMIKDQTLNETKDSRYREYEKGIIKDLIDFARIVNSSETKQEDDIGTMGVLATMCKALIIERDRINQVEYENHQLKKEIAVLSQKIMTLTEQVNRK